MPPRTVTRATLYEQVWTQPMLQLATQYGVSGNGLAKACRKANIPVPPRGYWAKQQHGKPVMPRPPLPPTAKGRTETITITRGAPASGRDPRVDARAAVEQDPANRIVVADQLRQPHSLVQDVAAALAEAKTDGCGMKQSRTGKQVTVLAVRVGPATRSRALRLLDALIKALETRGYEVTVNGVRIEGEWVPIALTEKEARTPHVPTPAELARKKQYSWERIPDWDYAPSGQLSLYSDVYLWGRSDLHKRWSDRKTVHLEDRLNDVVIGLVAIGVVLRERADEHRRAAEAWAEQQRRQAEQARQARMEKARRDNLLAGADDWTRAERIRQLIAAVGGHAASDEDGVSDAVQSWIAWATSVADELDPLAAGVARLLQKHQQVAEDDGQPAERFRYNYSHN